MGDVAASEFQYLVGPIETLGDFPVIYSVADANQSSDSAIFSIRNNESSI